MIHRGVQYTRAIRAYYKKFRRYPTKLEDLDTTNNLHYLRKHYKDPLNKNKDFRLLHFGEQGVTMAGGIAGALIPGASPAGAAAGLNGSGASSSAFGGGSGLGGSGLGGSTMGSGLGNSGVNSSGVFAQSSGLGGNSTSGTSSNSPGQATAASGASQGETSSSSQQLLPSGPIVGVASVCDKDTIRIFNKKKKYNEWQFLYDPSADRGGLITTPYQPALPNFTAQPLQNGTQAGSAGNSSGVSSFGQSSGQSSFGQSGFGNNSSSGSTPTQPASPQQQQ